MRKNRSQKSRFLGCRMEPHQERKLIALAGAKGVSVSSVMRELVESAPDPLAPGTKHRGRKSEDAGSNLGGFPASSV